MTPAEEDWVRPETLRKREKSDVTKVESGAGA